MPDIKIKVVRANLGREEKIKSPFVNVHFKGQTKKTAVLKGSAPEWNETLVFPCSDSPSPDDVIKIEVFDDDGFLGIDKSIGKAHLTYNALRLSKEKTLDLKSKKSNVGANIIVAIVEENPAKSQPRPSMAGGEVTHTNNEEKDEGVEMGGEGGDYGGTIGISGRTERSSLSDKPEDFQVRLKIIKGRHLTGSNIKPVVKIHAGKNETKITHIRKGSSPVWDEMLMFNFHESLKKLYDYIFELSVNNSKTLRADSVIGTFKLDLGSVYDQPGHAYVRKWILLTEAEDASSTPKGYLKITICVLGAGDQPPDEKSEGSDDDVEGNLLTPAGAALRAATFSMRVYHAEDLPQMDSSAFKNMKKFLLQDDEDISKTLVDPYVTLSFAGKKRKTRTIKETNRPIWNEELALPIKFPSMCDAITLTVKDWDSLGADDTIGTTIIPMSRISSTGEDSTGADIDEDDFDDIGGYPPTFGPTYINFYGSPREFSELGDRLDDLNHGKGEGCAYRGRALVELTTSIDEEGQDPTPPLQPIEEEQVATVQKYMRRRRYRLVVGFQSASMIDKFYDNIEFEVSIGNYGNKFETDVGTASSVTEATDPIFDGVKYYFIPWTSKKPVMMVTSQWEDISFRLFSINFILRLCDRANESLASVKKIIANKASEIEVASEIVAILDMLILETSKRLPDPRGRTSSNQLDTRIHRQRLQVFESVNTEATRLRQNCNDAKEALTSIQEMIERLTNVSYEPQNSVPDVIIWMTSGTKRIAYARIPAYDVLHCHENSEYSGRYCARPHTIILQYASHKKNSKKKMKIPCVLRITAWLGRAIDQEDLDFKSRGQISVYADTFENEIKIPVKGWTPDKFTDINGDVELPKSSFKCPSGWMWEKGWEISSDISLLHESAIGQITIPEDCFEHQYRFPAGAWQDEKVVSRMGEDIVNVSKIECPQGWEWDDDWKVDTNRVCDEEGWEYTTGKDGDEPDWAHVEKSYHFGRRRRLIRTRVCIDQKLHQKVLHRTDDLVGEGWEYASGLGKQFHAMPKMLDLARRRRWIRKMVTTESRGSAAIFNLEAIVKMEEEPPLSPGLMAHMGQTFGHHSGGGPSATSAIQDIALQAEKDAGVDGGGEPPQQPEPTDDGKGKKKKKGKSDSSDSPKKKKKKVPKVPAPKIYMLFEECHKLHMRAYIYQGRDLLPMDQDNFSDPVVMVSFLNQCRRTEVINHTLNPKWDQTLIMDINFYGDLIYLEKYCPDVMLDVFDKDEVGSLEFMGRTSGQPTLRFNPDVTEKSRLAWLNVKKGNLSGGNLLVAFEVFLKHEKIEIPEMPPKQMDRIMVPFGIRPVLQRTRIEVLVWGVRNMGHFQLLSVDSPSVLIQIGEVEIRTKIIKSLKKYPNFSDPRYYVDADLPVEQLYFPPIIIRVKDNRKFGRRPTVGQHIITDVSAHRTEPISDVIKADEPDEGFGDASPKDVAIEVEPPKPQTKRPSPETLPQDDAGVQVDEKSPLLTNEVKPSDSDVIIQIDDEQDKKIRSELSGDQDSVAMQPTDDVQQQQSDVSDVGDVESPSSDVTDPSTPKVDLTPPTTTFGAEEKDSVAIAKPDDVTEIKTREKKGKDRFMAFSSALSVFKDKLMRKASSAEVVREDELDWWSMYYASIGEHDKCGKYLESGLNLMKVYNNILEVQENFDHFSDFIQTFKLYKGKLEDEDDELDCAGEFKGAFKIYKLPSDKSAPEPTKFFEEKPNTDIVDVKIRVYVVRGTDLAPQDSNGLADPYLKIKVGKKRILDREHYHPNTLNPMFGRMFELDLKLPMDKDLHVEVFDWDLIGTDDKIGETIIDLENRYLSKYRAWCAFPEAYYTSGPFPWRDQMKPKDWLYEKAKRDGINDPVWNGNTCVFFDGKTHNLAKYEKGMKPCEYWGPADERLSLYVLRSYSHVSEHIESRPLFSDVIPGIEQGRIQMWVDMFPKTYGDPALPFNIEPRTPTKYFLKVIVWNCSEIPMMDTNFSGTQMTDIYFKGWLNGLESDKQKTDIHYRSLDGTGMFNWRLVFPFDYLPQERMVHISKKEHLWSLDKTVTKFPPTFNIQVWDNDLFGPNEYISELVVNLNNMPKCCRFQRLCTLANVPDDSGNCNMEMINLFDQKLLKGWWPLYKAVDGKNEQAGKLEMSIELVTGAEFAENPSGKARDSPNMNPKLDKPNRPATSFAWFSSPFKSFRYILWRKYKWIILGLLGALMLAAFIVIFLYSFPGLFGAHLFDLL